MISLPGGEGRPGKEPEGASGDSCAERGQLHLPGLPGEGPGRLVPPDAGVGCEDKRSWNSTGSRGPGGRQGCSQPLTAGRAVRGGSGDTRGWAMPPISLRRKLRPGSRGRAQVQPLLSRACGTGAACVWSRAPSGAPEATGAGDRSHPASGTGGWGLWGRGSGGDCQGRGPLPGPWWVGQRPPGSGCEARPSVAAAINMFVQGKPGWELSALAWWGRKGGLYLAHWGHCSCSRNCCPVAGKVRRPSGPVGSERCLRPPCSLPAAGPVARGPSGLARAGRYRVPAPARGRRSQEPPGRPGQPGRHGRADPAAPAPGREGARGGGLRGFVGRPADHGLRTSGMPG